MFLYTLNVILVQHVFNSLLGDNLLILHPADNVKIAANRALRCIKSGYFNNQCMKMYEMNYIIYEYFRC